MAGFTGQWQIPITSLHPVERKRTHAHARTLMRHGERFCLGLLRLGRGGEEVMAEADKRGLCLG
jgi:hypothetical protein